MSLHISVWSDIACPWCYVGKRRLEAALRLIGEKTKAAPAVTIEYKAFELDPRRDHQEEGEYIVRLAKKYGVTSAQAQDMVDRMTKTGAEEGLAFDFDNAVIANTFDAHRLLLLARALDENGKSEGLQATLKEQFMRAHFEEGADIASHDTLLRLADEAGLDVDKAAAVLASDDFSAEVRDDEEEAQLLGVSGVPFFAVGRFAVQGAQRAETLADIIQKALKEETIHPAEDDLLGEDFCLPDDC